MASPTPGSSGSVDFGRAFQFFFQDPDWMKKLLMGSLFALLSIILVGIPFLFGYEMRVLQRSYASDPRPLPEWDDYGGFFSDGLRAVGLSLCYFLGALLLPGSIGCVLAIMGGAVSRHGSEAAGGLFALGLLAMQVLAAGLILVVALYFPAAFTRMTLYQRFGAGLEFRENFDFIRRNPGNYALALVIWVVTQVIANVAVWFCCLPVFPATFWSNCVLGFVLGEVARFDSVLGQPAPAPSPGL